VTTMATVNDLTGTPPAMIRVSVRVFNLRPAEVVFMSLAEWALVAYLIATWLM